MTLYNEQIIAWLRPFANKLKEYVPSHPLFVACLLRPRRTDYVCRLPGGWAIPIGIMFVISFPPYVQRAPSRARQRGFMLRRLGADGTASPRDRLFGHEVVMILCGVVWGLWVGFAIVCAGTFLAGFLYP